MAPRSSTTRRRGGWIRLIPLVVSQVNPDDLEGHPGIIANPNCSTMQLAPVLMALRDTVGLERVVVDTYQSVSGTGARRAGRARGPDPRPRRPARSPVATVYPHPIAFNALPEIDVFLPNGYTREEWKVVTENRKILHLPDLRISCTAVRIPVFVSHSEAVHVETREAITPERARELFAAVPGVIVQDDPATHDYPLATEAAGRDEIFVGRVRRDISIADDRGIAFWVVSDNLRKGAATNAVELAEALRERDWIKPAAARGAKPFAASHRGHGVTDVERRTALEEIAAEVRVCTNCRLHQTRTKAVPGEGDPDTEVVFVGEGPGFNEDRAGPAVHRPGRRAAGQAARPRSAGAARTCSSRTSSSAGRPDNRDPQPDEIAACAPFLRRQLEVLDPAVVVTLGRFSMGDVHARCADLAGARHVRPVDPATGARSRARLRDVPPGRRAPDAGHRTSETLRR